MSFEPHKITREDVLKGIELLEKSESVTPSTKFDVVINGKPYPPKEVMRYAHQVMNGENIWRRSGSGGPATKFLENLGFSIIPKNADSVDPIKEIISRYKDFVDANGMSDEIYKWRLVKQFQNTFK